MHKFADHWELIDEKPGKDQIWRRNVRVGILIGMLGDCVASGILDSTDSKSPAEDDMRYELMISSI